MKMEVISKENRLCPYCMEKHDVLKVLLDEKTTFKNKEVCFCAEYTFCDLEDSFFSDEAQVKENDKRLKDAYRKEEGLLLAEDIRRIRAEYGISQSDLSLLLGWGAKTITRYESHQVQDKAHDAILRKIDADPEWFLALLDDSKEKLSDDSYRLYYEKAAELYEEKKDAYLRKAIAAEYAKYKDNQQLHGNTELSMDKVVDVIRYFAVSINYLYKVKLMKLMWYADALSYKRRGAAITGLIYLAYPMGAVPVGHNSIIDLKGVPCEEVDIEGAQGYLFSLASDVSFLSLSKEDISILDEVIEKLGNMRREEIISFMHNELAYTETAPREAIQFKYAEYLQI